MRISKDTLWKGLIEDFFPQLVAFFYPFEAGLLDFGRVEFLDTELQQLAPEFKGKRRHVDKLVKVWRREGSEAWILLHLEVQGYRDEEFALRMFTYAYRIFDRYGKLVEALAIFTDKDRNFHPQAFQLAAFKTQLDFRFQTYKVLDQNRADLLASGNPIALALVVVWDEVHLSRRTIWAS